MPQPTVARRWTLATWLVAGVDDAAPLVTEIGPLTADVVLLQSVRRDLAQTVADALGAQIRWALSHYPSTPLFRHSGVGLATITPHSITGTADRVVNEHRSVWSSGRRIAQTTLVTRSDHSAYAFHHAVPPIGDTIVERSNAPTVVVRPAQVGVDPARAVELPAGAVAVSQTTVKPIPKRADMLVVTFDLDWVRPDFPVP